MQQINLYLVIYSIVNQLEISTFIRNQISNLKFNINSWIKRLLLGQNIFLMIKM